MTKSTKIIKVDFSKTLSESDFFNPNLIMCFGSELESVVTRYSCDVIWYDNFLHVAGIEFVKDKQRVEFLLGRFELVELKNKFWEMYNEDLKDQLKSKILQQHRKLVTLEKELDTLTQEGSEAFLSKPRGASSKILTMLRALKNKGGPYNRE